MGREAVLETRICSVPATSDVCIADDASSCIRVRICSPTYLTSSLVPPPVPELLMLAVVVVMVAATVVVELGTIPPAAAAHPSHPSPSPSPHTPSPRLLPSPAHRAQPHLATPLARHLNLTVSDPRRPPLHPCLRAEERSPRVPRRPRRSTLASTRCTSARTSPPAPSRPIPARLSRGARVCPSSEWFLPPLPPSPF